MNIVILYSSTFILSLFILYLIIIDLKKMKLRLYNELDYKIWIKVYSLITIVLIHFLWLCIVLFTNNNDSNVIYGIPFYLFISYFIFIITEINIQNDCNISIATEKINRYINYLIYLYFICILIVIFIPNKIKIRIINCIRSINIYKLNK